MKYQGLRFVQKVCVVFLMAFFVAFGNGHNALAKNDVPGSFSELAEKQGDVAVNISSTRVVKGVKRFLPFQDKEFRDFFGDEFFKHFFGGEPQQEMKQRSLGSGVIVSEDGYILTNNHVVADAEEIQVILHNKKTYEAQIIGRDPKTDLALIKIRVDKSVPFAILGDSDLLRVGDWVVAIGNPFGLGSTVTAGIVSAKGRIIGAGPYDDFIQTDASINPGNSGGPLFNLDGEVVGINTAIFSQSGGNIGIGFAIPINLAKSVMSQLKEKGRVVRGWLGVTIQTVTPEIKEKFGLKTAEGALVGEVTKDSPADRGGIERGDVIVSFDGKKVEDMNSLPPMVAAVPDKEVEIRVIRKGIEKKLVLTTGQQKEEESAAAPATADIEESFGLSVQELSPELAESLSLKGEKGVVVSSVKRGSPAFEAEIERGDLIQEIEHQPVANLEEYRRIMGEAASKEQILLVVKHRGHTRYVVLKR
jgi:serine protease Do